MNTFLQLAISYISSYELIYCQEIENKEKHNDFIKLYSITIKSNTIPDLDIDSLPYLVQISCAYICYTKFCKFTKHIEVQNGWSLTKLKNISP